MEKESHLRREKWGRYSDWKKMQVSCVCIYTCGSNVYSKVRVTGALCKPVFSCMLLPELPYTAEAPWETEAQSLFFL